MDSDFSDLLGQAEDYEFDPRRLDAVPITGVLRKSPNPKSCVLVLSSQAAGDLVVEIEADDVVKHEPGTMTAPGTLVTLHLKPTAIVSASLRGKLTNALVPAFVVMSAFGHAVREPRPSVPWREIVTPFSRLDAMLNLLDGLSWTECRVRGKAECEALHPAGPDRDRCISDRYIACGPRPTLRVDERVLEQLRGLLGGPVRS